MPVIPYGTSTSFNETLTSHETAYPYVSPAEGVAP